MKTVLHVETSIFFTKIAKDIFSLRGYKYISTNSYNEGLLLMSEYDVDMIFLSLEGDGMSCDEFIKNAVDINSTIPIYIISSNKVNERMKDLTNLGIVQYINKEDIENELIKCISEAPKVDNYKEMLKESSIAVIEDSHFSRLHLKEIFKNNEIKNVRYFANGKELEKSNKNFDIYLVDIILKDEFGKNVICKVRETNNNALIFAVTSLDNPKLLGDIVDNGADDIINKPIEEIMFISKLKSHMRIKDKCNICNKF